MKNFDQTREHLLKEIDLLKAKVTQLEKSENEHKKLEEALRGSEAAMMKSIFRAAPIGIGVVINRNIQFVNQKFIEMIGYSAEELIGQNSRIVYPSNKEFDRVGKYKYEQIRKHGKGMIKTQLLRKDGHLIDVLLSSTTIDFNDISKGVIFTVTDITQSKQAEKELILKNLVFETSIAGNSISDNEGIITHCNSAFLKIWGYTLKDEVIGKPISYFIKNEDEALKIITSLNESGVWEGEYTGLKRDSTTFNAYGLATIVRNKKGENIGYYSAVLDITERKQALEKIKHLNLVLRAIRNVNQLITKEKDRNKLIDGACKNLIETRGYFNAWIVLLDESGKFITTAEAGLGKDFIPMTELMKSGKLTTCSKKALKKSEIVITRTPQNECKDCPLPDNYKDRSGMTIRLEYEGKIYGLMTISITKELINDIEEQNLLKEVAGDIAYALYSIEVDKKRKLSEKALVHAAREWQTTFDAMSDSVSIIEIDGHFLQWNSATLTMFNISDSEIKDKHCWQLVHNLSEPIENCPYVRMKKSKQPESMIFQEGERWLEVSVDPIIDNTGQIKNAVHVVRDITEHKLSEETLRESKSFNETLLNTSPDIIYIYDLIDRKNVYSNKGIMKILGYTVEEIQAIGENFLPDLMHPDDFKEYLNKIVPRYQIARDGEIIIHEYRMKHKDGMWAWLLSKESIFMRLDNGKPKQIFGLTANITERKQAEEEIIEKSKKLEKQYQASEKQRIATSVVMKDLSKTTKVLKAEIIEHNKAEVELNKKMSELEIFNTATVDRELKINDLRKEINELLMKLGRDEKYKIVE